MVQKKNKIKYPVIWGLVLVFAAFALGVTAYLVIETKRVMKMPPRIQVANPFFHLPPPRKGPYLGAYLAGSMAVRNGDMQKAADYYGRALALDADNKTLLAQTYAAERENGYFRRMLMLADRMQAQGLAQSEPAYVRFVGLVTQGDYAAALELLQTKPGVFAPDAALRIWCLIGMGDTTKALREWKALDVRSTKTDTARLQKALIADYLGKTEEAERAFLSLTEVTDVTANALAHARVFFKKHNKWTPEHPLYGVYLNKLRETASMASIVDSLQPPVIDTPAKGMAEVFHGLVIDASSVGNANTALLAILAGNYLDDKSPFLRLFAAQVYEALHMYQLANRQYDALPDFDILKLKKAANLAGLDKMTEALRVLEPIKDRLVTDDPAQLLLAEMYLTQKRYQDAIHHYNLFMSLVPPKSEDWLNALFARGVAYHELGDSAAAERDIAAATALAPDNGVMLNYLGYLWLTQDKNIDEAVALIEKAVALAPDDANFIDSLAWGYYKQKRYDEALNLAEKATDALPHIVEVNEHLGDIYAAVGRARESQYQYQKALVLDKNIKPADKARLQGKIK